MLASDYSRRARCQVDIQIVQHAYYRHSHIWFVFTYRSVTGTQSLPTGIRGKPVRSGCSQRTVHWRRWGVAVIKRVVIQDLSFRREVAAFVALSCASFLPFPSLLHLRGTPGKHVFQHRRGEHPRASVPGRKRVQPFRYFRADGYDAKRRGVLAVTARMLMPMPFGGTCFIHILLAHIDCTRCSPLVGCGPWS